MISPDAAMPESGKPLAKPLAVTMMSGGLRSAGILGTVRYGRTRSVPRRGPAECRTDRRVLVHGDVDLSPDLGDWNCLQCWSIPTAPDSHRVPHHRRRR